MTVEEIQHKIDVEKDPVAALGFNGTWPGPRLTVVEGDKVRAIFKNNLPESTGIHFHGQRLPNAMDGVPHITQAPILPGESFTYEVRVASGQRVIERGAYEYVRHPAYTAGLLIYAGIGLALCNWGSIAVTIVPSLLAYSYRIAVEERALVATLGPAYVDYAKRTKRVIPFLI